jgi:pyruvate/2-oxoglutarate dehydrogenase complex dihydrolipoamide dehydrogenase (E3) component
MLVIGGGAGGLVTAIGSAGCGAKVAIIERSLFGGDCLNTGCVPSKAFLKCANVAQQVKNCAEFGIEIEGPININFAKIMERMRKIRASISENDSAKRLVKTFGIDVFLGQASFVDKNKVTVNDQVLSFSKCCLATGARPYIPLINGLD